MAESIYPSIVERFRGGAALELRPQLNEFEPTSVRLTRLRELGIKAGFWFICAGVMYCLIRRYHRRCSRRRAIRMQLSIGSQPKSRSMKPMAAGRCRCRLSTMIRIVRGTRA